MTDAVMNAVLNAVKLSSAADVSVCRKKIAAIGAGAWVCGAGAIGNSVKNAASAVSIL